MTFCVVMSVLIAGCGGPATPEEDSPYPDIDQILTQSELKLEDGTHLPEAFFGSFRLSKIETVSEGGLQIAEQTVDPSVTITVTAGQGEPFDTFAATSNFLSNDTIEVTGQVSLDIDSSSLIVKVLSSNTPSIVEGETYVLNFGTAAGSGFAIIFGGEIGGENVDIVYTFEKI